MIRWVLAVGAALLAAACGSDRPVESEDYGNLLVSPGGLVVVRDEHPSGWGRQDCFGCHEVRNMHVVNRTGIPDLNLEAVRAVVLAEGEASCAQCHGTNGARP